MMGGRTNISQDRKTNNKSFQIWEAQEQKEYSL